jgi:hypothetical protein
VSRRECGWPKKKRSLELSTTKRNSKSESLAVLPGCFAALTW